MAAEQQEYMTKSEVLEKLGVTSIRLNAALEVLKVETKFSNRDRRIQLISQEDYEKLKKYFAQ